MGLPWQLRYMYELRDIPDVDGVVRVHMRVCEI